MGMSASQARFLGLTARKSNVEYEGQQVNQQRTNLSNQSAILYDQMLAIQVPTPPDVTKYYNDTYTFQDGDVKYEIINGLGSSKTCTVSSSENLYQIYSQPASGGLNVMLELLNGKLMLNNKLLNEMTPDVSREQVRSILDNGNFKNEPPFVATVPYSEVTEDSYISDPTKSKYINKLDEISDDELDGEEFQDRYLSGVPTYFAITDENDKTVFVEATDENAEYIELLSDTAKEVKVYQEARDGNNQPLKEKVTQDFCDNTEGLQYYFQGGKSQKEVSYTKATSSSTGQQYVSTTETSADALSLRTDLDADLADEKIICYKAVTDDDGAVTYTRITRAEALDSIEEDAKLYIVGAKSDNSTMIPVDSKDFIAKPTFYVTKETNIEVPDEYQTITLTQELWNEAKAAGNTELMDMYIDFLDYSDEENTLNNTIYYYISDNCTRYVQASYLQLPEGKTADSRKIPYEYYETEYNDSSQSYSLKDPKWTKDSSGRYTQISAIMPDGEQRTFKLGYEHVKDDDAYDQAMLDYEFRKTEYDKKMADINAKTAKIQQQDKNLELRLKQLDTEQKALSNEMEAVKKVIEKNVDETFKTFA